MASSATVLEDAGLGVLADDTDVASAEILPFAGAEKTGTECTGDLGRSDFELFMADLKAEVEQSLISSMVRDLRQLLSRFKPA